MVLVWDMIVYGPVPTLQGLSSLCAGPILFSASVTYCCFLHSARFAEKGLVSVLLCADTELLLLLYRSALQEEIVDETDTYIDNDKTTRVNARLLTMSLPPKLRRVLMAGQLAHTAAAATAIALNAAREGPGTGQGLGSAGSLPLSQGPGDMGTGVRRHSGGGGGGRRRGFWPPLATRSAPLQEKGP